MKKIIIILFATISFFAFGQKKYITKNGVTKFEASIAGFEEIKGTNSSTSAILNPSNGELVALALTTGYKFKLALMEEHFNENYMESSKFPKAVFKGKINNFIEAELTAVPKNYTITGNLEMHGMTKAVTSSAKIYKKDNAIFISGIFSVKPEDYGISIPSAVSKKVSKNISVDYNFNLK